ncbi:hypothetical protein DOJK_00682 [Patescibacteria group bacterium]|nr:hypothetical protein [Candidatus Dojkabacteria bacterium]CAG1020963.1 hypothetical protein DOJK_00682 [Patescibacteria group bacterium]
MDQNSKNNKNNKAEKQLKIPISSRLKVNFNNALIGLVGMAILSVIVYALIIRSVTDLQTGITGSNINQGTDTDDEPERIVVTQGNGYIVYIEDNEYVLEVTDGRQVPDDPESLITELGLPANTRLIAPAVAFPRPIDPSQLQDGEEPPQHGDLDFDPINPQPEQPTGSGNE